MNIQTAASVDYFSRNKQSNVNVFTDLQSDGEIKTDRILL